MGAIKYWWQEAEDQTLTEVAWERQMLVSGMEAYELSRSKKKVHETTTGKKYLSRMVTTAEKAIKALQSEMVTFRTKIEWKSTLTLLPADTMALIGLRRIIDQSYGVTRPEIGAQLQLLAKAIGRDIELETTYRDFVSQSKEASKAYAKAHGRSCAPVSLAERLIKEHGLKRTTLHRWHKSLHNVVITEWNNEQLHFCGDAITGAIVKALPKSFEINLAWDKGRTIKHVRMTPEFREQFDSRESRVAALQAHRKPMLVRPRPWTREEYDE